MEELRRKHASDRSKRRLPKFEHRGAEAQRERDERTEGQKSKSYAAQPHLFFCSSV